MAKKAAAAAPAFTAEQLAFIKEREEILRWLGPAQAREMEIRLYLAAILVPSPTEGTQRLVTADGYEVILNHKINRSVQEPLLDSVMLQFPENAPERTPGVLIRYKPELVTDGYRNLSAENLKIIGQAITAKPGAPELTIQLAKKEEAPEANVISASQLVAATITQEQVSGRLPNPDRTERIKKAVKAGKKKK